MIKLVHGRSIRNIDDRRKKKKQTTKKQRSEETIREEEKNEPTRRMQTKDGAATNDERAQTVWGKNKEAKERTVWIFDGEVFATQRQIAKW